MDDDFRGSDWSDPQGYDPLHGRIDPQDYDPYESGGLRQNDPYRNMRSAEDDTRPDFLKNPKGVASGENDDNGANGSAEQSSDNGGENAERNREAKESLKSAEEEASGETPKEVKDSVEGTKKNEEDAGGFYSGDGKEKKKKLGKSGGVGFMGKFKKKAPILAIFMVVCGAGGGLLGAQSILPFAIEELLIEKFNSIGVSSSIVSDEMLDLQLNQGIRQGAPDPANTDTLFGLSDYQVQQFKVNGIDAYNVSAGGKSGAIMLYKKHAGEMVVPVVGSNLIDSVSGDEIISEASKLSSIEANKFVEPVGVTVALDDKDFYVPYMTASKVWRSGTSSWFDKVMKSVTEIKLNVTRTRWSNFIARKITDVDADFRKKFNKVAAGTNKVSDENGSVVRGKKQEPIYEDRETTLKDSQGHPIINADGKEVKTTERVQTGTETVEYNSDTDGNGGSGSLPEAGDAEIGKTSTAEGIRNALNSKAVRAAQAASGAVCALTDAAIAIYSTVQAYQAMQFLNLISGFLESVDRVKAGDGGSSPVMEYMSNMTTKSSTRGGDGEAVKDDDGKVVRKSGMESAGMNWLFNKKSKIDSNDPSVKNTNIESLMSNLTIDGLSDFGNSALNTLENAKGLTKMLEACGYVRMASSAINLISDGVLLVGTLGIGNVLKFFGKKLLGTAISVAVVAFVGIILEKALQSVANLIIKNAATEWFGEDLGNAVISGASRYLGGNGTSGGQGPGTESAVTSYLVAQHGVIAKEALYQRAVKSPFDTSSPYTFLGSLLYSIIPLAYSSGGIMSAITGLANTTSNALVAMLPTANAIDTESAISSTGDCDLLKGGGIIGDAYCNPYIITDVNTTNLVATDVYNVVAHGFGGEIAGNNLSYIKEGNLDSNGKIVENSELSKYVTFCGQRTSQYNLYDASIAGQVSGKNGTDHKILKYVPIADDVISIVENAAIEANIDWVNGMECVVGGSHWGDNKYYQRYTENERLLEGMNPDYTSPVTAYLTEYYEKNPLDTSFEGTLARFSGQTKEDVELALDLIEYYDYINNYDPSSRYAFVEKEEPEPIFFEDVTGVPEVDSALAIEPYRVVYADLRGRYYTV